MDNEPEEWRPVPGWEGLYEVSSLGRVRSLDRVALVEVRFKGKVLSPVSDGKGYLHQVFTKGGKRREVVRIHSLVCKAFHGQPSEGAVAAHADGNKHNNRASNLRWATIMENAADSVRHGQTLRGSKAPNSRLTEDQVRAIRNDPRGPDEIARDYGVSKGAIDGIRSRKNWKWLD